MNVDRNWFITIGTYGSRLPGDERGFVGFHRPRSRDRETWNQPGTEHAKDIPRLQEYAASVMTGEPIALNLNHATVLLQQFQETASFRNWRLWAVSIMANHFHLAVGIPGDPDPEKIRGSFKSYGSRRLNERWGKPSNGTWWAKGGSNRKLPTDESLLTAIRYTIEQEYPLIVWTTPIPELNLPGGLILPGEPAP